MSSKCTEEYREKLTLRVNESLSEYTKKKAEAIGISHNAFLNILLDLGLRQYEKE